MSRLYEKLVEWFLNVVKLWEGSIESSRNEPIANRRAKVVIELTNEAGYPLGIKSKGENFSRPFSRREFLISPSSSRKDLRRNACRRARERCFRTMRYLLVSKGRARSTAMPNYNTFGNAPSGVLIIARFRPVLGHSRRHEWCPRLIALPGRITGRPWRRVSNWIRDQEFRISPAASCTSSYTIGWNAGMKGVRDTARKDK